MTFVIQLLIIVNNNKVLLIVQIFMLQKLYLAIIWTIIFLINWNGVNMNQKAYIYLYECVLRDGKGIKEMSTLFIDFISDQNQLIRSRLLGTNQLIRDYMGKCQLLM